MKLLTPASYQTKLRKTELAQPEFAVYSLSLAPAHSAGTGKSVCPSSTSGCEAACVGAHTGLARVFPTIMRSRTEKTIWLQTDREGFVLQLRRELHIAIARSAADGRKCCVRLNAFSDLPWHRWLDMEGEFSACQFYDYSKEIAYFRPENQRRNYSRCFSRSGENDADCLRLLSEGHNVSVVFAEHGSFSGTAALKQHIPQRWSFPGDSRVWTVFRGDEHDLRIPQLDPGPTARGRGRICGLTLKSGDAAGRISAIESGFAVLT